VTAPTTEHRPSFWVRHRTRIMAASVVASLPPLALVFQPTGDVGFCGGWCPRMFWTWRQGQSLADWLLGLARAPFGVALVLALLAVTWLVGRAWCSHLCPVGGVMELVSRAVPDRLKLDFGGVPAAPVRYGYLAVYLAAPALGVGSLCCSYCNFAAVPRLFGAAFSGADLAYFMRTAGLVNLGLVVVLGFLARGGRAYCNLLCPVGALDSLVSRAGLTRGKRVRVLASKCTGCGTCATVCPTWALSNTHDKAQLDALSCLTCRECEQLCPEEAIRYGKQPA
jgi:ferredoxin-type protein NapH